MARTPKRPTAQELLQENATLLTRLNEAEGLVRAAHAADQELIRQLQQEMAVRWHADQAAKAERQRLYDVLETLPVYVALLERDYHVPFANRFFRERFGESHGRCCFEYLFNRSSPCENCESFKVLKTGGPHHWEWTGPDGRDYDIHDFLFTDSDGSTLILEMGIDVSERNKAEAELVRHREHLEELILSRTAALAASEQRYRGLFESMAEGFAVHEIITDESGRPCDYRFLEVNPAFERLTGLAPAQLIGKRVLEALPGTDPFWIETYGRVALTGEPVHFERFFAPLDRWYGVFAYCLKPGQFAVIFSDITSRKLAEDDVRRQREWLQVTLTSIADAVIAGDTDRRITFLNPVAAEMTGWSEQEAIGRPVDTVLTIVNEQTREPAEDVLERVLTERRRAAVGNNTVLLTRDGREVPIEDSAAPIFDAAGRLSGFVLVFHDVTERRVALQAARENEARWRLAQRAANAGWWEWDLHTNENVWSDELWRVYGLDPHSCEPSYETWRQVMHPDDRARVEADVLHAARTATELVTEWRVRDRDGTERWLMSRGQPVRDAGGTVARYVGIVIDITARKRAEQAHRDLADTLERRVTERTAEVQEQAFRLRALAADLGQAEQRERKRIARVLHDHVQQLLAAARMELEALNRAPAAARTADDLSKADAILNEAMRALRSLAVELSPPILHEAGLTAALRWLAARMGDQHQLQVNVYADGGIEPTGEDVRVLLFECVRELLLNVLRHSGVREARLSVTRTSDDRIRIAVEDSGLGFDPGGLWTRTDGHGTLGLFNVQERLAHVGGSMRIDSAPGQGTRVVIIGPAAETQPASATRQASGTERGAATTGADGEAGRRIRVLVVDDHPIVREGLVKSLQFEPDIDVVGEAADAFRAMTLAGTVDPDVVIMDVNLGTTSGIDATRAIRRAYPRISVVGLSVHDDEEVAEAMRRAGATTYLSKAGRTEELVAAIRACVKTWTRTGRARP